MSLMQQPPTPTGTTQRRRSFLRWLIRGVVIGLLLFPLGVIAIFQLPPVRQWVLQLVVTQINETVFDRATLQIGDVKGTLWDHLDFYDLLITVDADTLLWIPHLAVSYNVEKLLQQRVALTNVIVERPLVRLFRALSDTMWNYHRLFRVDSPSVGRPPQWSVDVHRLVLINGRFQHIDARARHQAGVGIQWHQLDVTSLNASAQLRLDLATAHWSLFVHHLSGKEQYSHFQIRQFRGALHRGGSMFELFNAILQTSQSAMRINMRVQLADTGNIGWDVTIPSMAAVDIKVDSVSLEELRLFFPDLPLGHARPRIQLVADLNDRRLVIHRLDIGWRNSQFRGRGTIVLQPSLLQSSLAITDLYGDIQVSDVQQLFPSLLPPHLRIQRIQLEQTRFEGTLDRAVAEVKLHIDQATVTGKVRYDRQNDFYGGWLRFRNIDLSAFDRSRWPSSQLTGRIQAEAHWSSIAEANGTVRLQLWSSTVARIPIHQFFADLSMQSGTMEVDTLWFAQSAQQGNVVGSGVIALHDSLPLYVFQLHCDRLSMQQFDSTLDFTFSGRIGVSGQGRSVDEFVGNLRVAVEELQLQNQSVLPFTLSIQVAAVEEQKVVRLQSNFLTARLRGRFRWRNLIRAVTYHSQIAAQYFVAVVTAERQLLTLQQHHLDDSIECTFAVDVHNGAFLQPWLPPTMELWFQTALRGQLRQQAGRFSILELDSVLLRSFDLKTSWDTIQIFHLYGRIKQQLNPVDPSQDQLQIVLSAPYGLQVNTVDILSARSQWKRHGERAYFQIRAALALRDSLSLRLKGGVRVALDRVQWDLDTVRLAYGSRQWWSVAPVIWQFTPERMVIQQLALQGSGQERLQGYGLWRFGHSVDLTITLYTVPLADIIAFFVVDTTAPMRQLQGTMEQMVVYLNGDVHQPQLEIQLQSRELWYQQILLGTVSGGLRYRYGTFRGEFHIQRAEQRTLQLQLMQLPFVLSLEPLRFAIDTARPVYATIRSQQMPLAVLQPVLPFLTDLQGMVQAQIQVSGYLPHRLQYQGKASILRGRITVPATNIRYQVEGTLVFRKDTLQIDSIRLRNLAEDFRHGSALIYGTIYLQSFTVHQFDLYCSTPQLLVLSRATQAVSPTVYGTVVVRTRTPLRLSGTLENPALSGEVEILEAALVLPETEKAREFRYPFCYERIIYRDGKPLVIDRNCPEELYQLDSYRDTVQVLPSPTVFQPSFLQRLYYYLVIHFAKPIMITMEFSPLEQLVAELSAPEPLYYLTDPLTNQTQLYGELVVLPGSTYKFYRIFSTEGRISFRTGLDNPELDLVATLEGRRYRAQELQSYRVVIIIQGTKRAPKLRFLYYINGEEQAGDPQEVQANSIFLLLFGKTKEEFLQGNGDPQLASVLSSSLSSGLSKFITEVLQGTGIVRSADIVFQDPTGLGQWDLAQAEIRLRGEIAPLGLLWQYGGSVGDIARATFELNFPLGSLLDLEALRNLVLQIRRNVVQTQSLLTQQREYELKVLYRYSW